MANWWDNDKMKHGAGVTAAPPLTGAEPPDPLTDMLDKEKNIPVADKDAWWKDDAGVPELKQGQPEFNANPTSNVIPENDYSKMAGSGQQAVASLPTDIKQRAQYFAAKRFPNLPPEEAITKYGVQNGRLFYTGEDGKYYFEEPDANLSLSGTPKFLSSLAGPSLPAVGGTMGGIASTAAGGVPGAVAGAAVGDTTRQGLARLLAGDNSGFKPMQTAVEGGLAAAGQLGGMGMIKMGNRNAVRDVAKLADPKTKIMIDLLKGKADAHGISLTPAEMTNLSSIKGQQNVLGDLPASADIMGDFYAKRNAEQVPNAVKQNLDALSPIQSREVGANVLKQGAESAIDYAKAQRRSVSGPAYQKAFEKGADVDTAPILDGIESRLKVAKGGIKTALEKAKGLLQEGVEKQSPDGSYSLEMVPDRRLDALHEAKLALDDMIENTADTSIGRTARNELVQVKTQLVEAMKTASPEYEAAMSIHAAASPGVTALTQGEAGLASKASETNLKAAPRVIFESGPDAITKNRKAFETAGKQEDWNAGLRSYLSDAFNSASKEFKSGNTAPGAAYRAKVFSTPEQKAAMRAAMDDTQFAAFNDLMAVLEATGRVPQGGSRTAFAGQAMDEMRAQSGTVGKNVARVLSPQNIGRDIGSWYQELKFGQHAETLANIITSPDGMAKLKQLRTLSPNSEKARLIVAQLLMAAGANTLPPDEPSAAPGALSPMNTNQQ